MHFPFSTIRLLCILPALNDFFSERDKGKQLQFFHEEEVNAFLPDEEIDVLKLDSEFISTIDSTKPGIFSENMWGYRILYYNIRISDISMSPELCSVR